MTLFVLVVLQEVGDGAQVLSRFLQLSDLLAQGFQLGLLAAQHFVNIFHGASSHALYGVSSSASTTESTLPLRG